MARTYPTLYVRSIADKYGNERDKKRALLLDAVMGGQQRASQSRLLQMPAEILAEIVDLLGDSKSALANLALVNSDCRQLARTSQFVEVTFDSSGRSKGLFAHLAKEAGTPATKPSISACVRRATFAAYPARELDDEFWSVDSLTFSEEEIQTYIRLRNAMAPGISAMPNLEALIWIYPLALDTAFFQLITRSKAWHVKLSKTMVNGPPGSLEPPLMPSTWPIRSLDLELAASDAYLGLDDTPPPNADTEPQMSKFFEMLFRLCSPTLESLRWSYNDLIVWGKSHCNPVSFPRLRELHLQYVQLEKVGFSSVFSPLLRSLQLSGNLTIEDAAEELRHRNFPQLEAFAIPLLPYKSQFCEPIVDFIVRHQHVKKLYIHEPEWAHGREANLDRLIIPALASHSFNHLRSLSLAWGGGTDIDDEDPIPYNLRIPKRALLALEKLISLEQLSLSVGNGPEKEAQWAVKHPELLASLGKLRKLKRLALSRDTYPVALPEDERECDDYYKAYAVSHAEIRDAQLRPELDIEEDLKVAALDEDEDEDDNDDDDDDNDEDDEGEDNDDEYEDDEDDEDEYTDPFDDYIQHWTRAHRNRMLSHAENYAAVLPDLEWMLCGRWPMALERDPVNPAAPRKAVPLTQRMDHCITFLKKTFGCDISQA